MALLRPSDLARFWALHPTTVVNMIRDGKLVAVRSPGGQWRVRPADVIDLCARTGMPVPPAAAGDAPRVVVGGGEARVVRGVKRALEGDDARLAFASPLDAVLACAREAVAVLAIDASSKEVDAAAAIASLLRAPATTRVIAFDAPSASRARALEKAGAFRVLDRGAIAELAAAIRDALSTSPDAR